MSGKVRRTRSRRQVRLLVSELPAEASSVHIRATPMPCHATEIITMSIPAFAGTALPKSRLVRSIASTHALPSSPRRSATIRAEQASSSRTNWNNRQKRRRTEAIVAALSTYPASRHRQIVPYCTGQTARHQPDQLPEITGMRSRNCIAEIGGASAFILQTAGIALCNRIS